MFLKLGVFILLVVVITSDCERAPTLPLLPGTYRQIFRSFVPVPKGRSLSLSDVKIAYYRDSVENRTLYRTREIESLLKDKTFVLQKPTVFYIHGYVEYVTDKSVGTVVSAYIRRGGYNVLALDWANLAFGNYFNVLFDIQPVGDEAGRALVKLLKAGLQLQGLHIVGHSMGVQVGAVAARHLAAEGYTVERLTGLDPAYPGFYPPILTKPISPKDARFVDNIHTAGGQIGTPFSGGHVDFWPNGGKPPQPGCPPKYLPFSDEYFCSHWRSWRYWAESVVGGKFVATKCDSYDAFLKGSCSGRALMGLQATPDLHGDYYLRTAAEEPFALGERVLITSDCQGAPSLPLPGSFRQALRSFVPTPIGRSLNLNDVKIVYYGDNVKNNTFYRTRDIELLLKDRTFVLEKPTVLYIHGYLEFVTDDSVRTVVSAYIKHGGYNILALDWSNLAFGIYINVLFGIQPVGDEAGEALVKLLNAGLQLQGFHIVGHSLGSQVGAVAARYLASKGYLVKWLTGLDPAFPGFYPPVVTKPISPNDALFVDIIHTDAGEFVSAGFRGSSITGSPVSGGQVDFWPNGGKPVQLGCPKIFVPLSDENFCSHWRSWQYWAESVLGGNFLATKCSNYDAFLKGSCTGLGRMGLQATPDLHEDYYLRTAAEEPFALGERGV